MADEMSKSSVSPSKVYVNEDGYDPGTGQASHLRLKLNRTLSSTMQAEEVYEVYASYSI